MTGSPAEMLGLTRARGLRAWRCRRPTISSRLLHLAGLASAGGGSTEVLVEGYTYGSLSMTSYTVDA